MTKPTIEPGLFDTPVQIQTTAAPKPAGMATWLIRRLEAAGYMDPDTGATRKARYSRCRHCGRFVMIGIDADWCGMTAVCDPDPLSRDGEALALIAGIQTYMLSKLAGPYELNYRDQWRIRGWPAATARFDVLASHDCSRTLQLARAPSVLDDTATPPAYELSDIPPF